MKRPELSLDLSITDVTERYRDLVRRGQQMEAQRREERMTRPRRAKPQIDTTKLAKLEGKARGWGTPKSSERYNRAGFKVDVDFAMDVIWRDPSDPRLSIGVQAAGPGQRAAHWRRFRDWCEHDLKRSLTDEECVARARACGFQLWYWVFDLDGSLVEERWA